MGINAIAGMPANHDGNKFKGVINKLSKDLIYNKACDDYLRQQSSPENINLMSQNMLDKQLLLHESIDTVYNKTSEDQKGFGKTTNK